MPSFIYHTLLFLFLLLFFETSAAAVGLQRSLFRSLGEGTGLPDYAVDLNSSTFDSILKESPASFAIVEFFAHWCPACRNYKPHYEKVARLFNGPNAVHPGIILMTRVDCAMKVNTNLCEKFSVGRYPMLLCGPPHKFTSAGWDPKQEKSEIMSIDNARTAEQLLNWINKITESSFSLDDEKYDNGSTLPWNATDPEQIARAIYDVEEATSQLFDIITDSKRITKETRAPLIKFFQLLIAHHPSKRCRRGTAEILVNFDEMWPLDYSISPQNASRSYPRDVNKTFPICGKDVPRGYWIFCRGSSNETRGYSCGLWILLHSLSVRIGDGEAQLTFTVIHDFVYNFFICEECRRHFHEMCSSAPVPFNTTRALVLWLWRSHNNVNERLMREEKESGTEDHRYPKMIWPPKDLCPSCSFSSSSKAGHAILDWNEDEVFKFITNYYGSLLVSAYKDDTIINRRTNQSVDDVITTAHAVAVPVGAALAIAVASCAFGALAYFWRTQQKNRKRKSTN
ncbi:sulfhydryl oxidase 1-like isoform X2 [Phalaenopsis equestris]|uniref:sulfhydryl oxidase 1-like isoform X2 n=1 Tax=Phalaenopsis equestris TaxID=78828 RepID=UPI0009E4FD5C|nr:sulfhydryl oxidase 1-like isoform X2 [Phalaenopsis equestris]